MNKLLVKGNTLKDVSDPKLAKSHKQGVTINYVQPAKDNVWGKYYFNQYHRNYSLFAKLEHYYKKTTSLLNECRKLQINDKTNDRFIPDELRNQLEFYSMFYIVFTKLAFEYLTIELLNALNNTERLKQKSIPKVSWENLDLIERLKILLHNLKLDENIPEFLIDIFKRRDIVEHPSETRLWNCDENGWKNVHLSWVLSGEIVGSFDKIVKFVNPIYKSFEKYINNNQIPGTLTGLKRGLRSNGPIKKWKMSI